MHVSQNSSKRIWKTATQEESRLLSEVLSICSWKLTNQEMADLHQEDLSKLFEAIRDKRYQLEDLKKLDANELKDLIVGQMRLF